jgi:hypothetical protein
MGLFLAHGVTWVKSHSGDCLQLIYKAFGIQTKLTSHQGKEVLPGPVICYGSSVYRSLRGCSRQAKSNMNGSDKASEKTRHLTNRPHLAPNQNLFLWDFKFCWKKVALHRLFVCFVKFI